mgnify:FL=1
MDGAGRLYHTLSGSNRTIVGLKQRKKVTRRGANAGSNRTIVGLKRVCDYAVFVNYITAAIAPLWD